MNKKPMLALNLSTFVVSLGYSLVIPAMPYLMESLGAGGRELGWLTAIYALTQTICAPFWGALSDQVGRKPVMSIGMIGYAVSLCLFGIASSYWTLFIARGLSGILSSATSAASMAYIGDSVSEQDRSKNMGRVGAAMSVGTVIGPVIGGVLSGYSLSLPFFVGGGIAFVAFLLILVMLPESLTRVHKSEHQRFAISALQSILTSRAGMVLVLIFIASFCQTGLQGITGLYVVDKFGLNPRQVGFLWMALAGVLVIGQGFLLGPLSNRISEKILICTGLAGGAVCLFAMTLTGGYISVLIVLCAFALTVALTVPTLNASLSKATDQNKGALMGMASTVRSLSKVVGPLLFGYMYEASIELPYVGGAVVALVGVVLCVVWMKNSRVTV